MVALKLYDASGRTRLLTGKSFVSRDETEEAGLAIALDWIDEFLLDGTAHSEQRSAPTLQTVL